MRYILTGLFCCLFLSPSFAASMDVSTIEGDVSLSPYAEYVLTSRTNSFSAPPENAQFSSVSETGSMNFGFSSQRLWLRFTLRNSGDLYTERYLNIRYPLLDQVRLYRLAPDGKLEPAASPQGRLNPAATSDHGLPSRFFALPIHLAADETSTFYLSIESEDSLAIPLFLSTEQSLQNTIYWDAMGLMAYFGPVITNILFALFMLVQLRDREILFYTACLTTNHLIYFALMERVPYALFGWDSVFINRDIIAINVCISILMFTLFAREFLNLREAMPKAYRQSHWMVGLMLVTTLLSAALPHFYAITVSSISCMAVAIFYCVVVSQMMARKLPNTGRFITAWGFGLLGAMIYALKVWNLVPVNFFTEYAWHMGSLVEAILFSLSIANRAAEERQHKLEAQGELIAKEQALRATQEKLLQAESDAKHELEREVKARTQDLSRLLSRLESENKWLEELSINDSLTQVRNRRFFDDMLQQMWKEASEQQEPISIMLLDIDHFKQVNDQYGHLAGDVCLQQVAEQLRYCITRSGDVICRYGGEEFVVLLPQTSVEQATGLAEKVRKRIADTLIKAEGHEFHVTSSFGVGGYIPSTKDDALQLVSQCDQALYASKEAGRNRVTPVPDRPEHLLTPLTRIG